MAVVFTIMHFYSILVLLLFLAIPLFNFFKSGIDKLDGVVDSARVPSLMYIFNKCNIKGTNFKKVIFNAVFYVCVGIG